MILQIWASGKYDPSFSGLLLMGSHLKYHLATEGMLPITIQIQLINHIRRFGHISQGYFSKWHFVSVHSILIPILVLFLANT